MDYKRAYYRLLRRGIQRDRRPKWWHRHHVVPRYTGVDLDFVVILSPKEHLLIHRLMYRAFDGHEQSLFAYNKLLSYVSTRSPLFGWTRPPRSEEWCRKISLGKMGSTPWNKGKSQPSKNRWVNDGQVERYIPLDLLDQYLGDGWKRGRTGASLVGNSHVRGRVWVTRDGETKMVQTEELNDHIRSGWVRGRMTMVGNQYAKKRG